MINSVKDIPLHKKRTILSYIRKKYIDHGMSKEMEGVPDTTIDSLYSLVFEKEEEKRKNILANMQQEGKTLIQKIQHTGFKIQQLKVKMQEAIDHKKEEEETENLFKSL